MDATRTNLDEIMESVRKAVDAALEDLKETLEQHKESPNDPDAVAQYIIARSHQCTGIIQNPSQFMSFTDRKKLFEGVKARDEDAIKDIIVQMVAVARAAADLAAMGAIGMGLAAFVSAQLKTQFGDDIRIDDLAELQHRMARMKLPYGLTDAQHRTMAQQQAAKGSNVIPMPTRPPKTTLH